MRLIILGAIWLYQKTISFDHGPAKSLFPYGFCRFYPSCSEYARQAIGRHGVARGGYLAAHRLCRCHPFSPGGLDEVPE